ncbi:hypothetical protein HQ563_14020 [bacterium]|nr:hypothetical protein [bacterium]
MRILEQLGICGWKTETENLLLASLLIGDPALLVGRHGCAKTHIVCKLAEALDKNFVAYDASKTLFDDVLGYPDIEKMKQGYYSQLSVPAACYYDESKLDHTLSVLSEHMFYVERLSYGELLDIARRALHNCGSSCRGFQSHHSPIFSS